VFTTVAVLTMGFGIAINCAMFSVLNTVLLRPLPYRDAARIVELSQSNAQRGLVRQLTVSVPDYLDWKEQNQVFDGWLELSVFQSVGIGRAGARSRT